MENPKTSRDCLAAGFSALLRGDTTERDRLCDRAMALLEAERLAAATERVLSVDFYVTTRGIAVASKAMAKAAGVME